MERDTIKISGIFKSTFVSAFGKLKQFMIICFLSPIAYGGISLLIFDFVPEDKVIAVIIVGIVVFFLLLFILKKVKYMIKPYGLYFEGFQYNHDIIQFGKCYAKTASDRWNINSIKSELYPKKWFQKETIKRDDISKVIIKITDDASFQKSGSFWHIDYIAFYSKNQSKPIKQIDFSEKEFCSIVNNTATKFSSKFKNIDECLYNQIEGMVELFKTNGKFWDETIELKIRVPDNLNPLNYVMYGAIGGAIEASKELKQKEKVRIINETFKTKKVFINEKFDKYFISVADEFGFEIEFV